MTKDIGKDISHYKRVFRIFCKGNSGERIHIRIDEHVGVGDPLTEEGIDFIVSDKQGRTLTKLTHYYLPNNKWCTSNGLREIIRRTKESLKHVELWEKSRENKCQNNQ